MENQAVVYFDYADRKNLEEDKEEHPLSKQKMTSMPPWDSTRKGSRLQYVSGKKLWKKMTRDESDWPHIIPALRHRRSKKTHGTSGRTSQSERNTNGG